MAWNRQSGGTGRVAAIRVMLFAGLGMLLILGALATRGQSAATRDQRPQDGSEAIWKSIGPATGGNVDVGEITALEADPSDATGKTIYFGTASGKIWRTEDGANWIPSSGPQSPAAIRSIVFDRTTEPPAMYALGGQARAGVLKSIDGGRSWIDSGAELPGSNGAAVTSLTAGPPRRARADVRGGVLLAGAAGQGAGIWRSTNGGATWTQTLLLADRSAVTDLAFDANDETGQTAYAAANGPDMAGGFYVTNDAGQTWNRLPGIEKAAGANRFGRVSIAVGARAGGNAEIYEAIGDAATDSRTLLGIFRSVDGGVTFTDLSGELKGAAVNAIVADPVVPGTIYAATATGVLLTHDGGAKWTSLGNGLPVEEVTSLSLPVAADLPAKSRLLRAGTVSHGVWEVILPAAGGAPSISSLNPSSVQVLSADTSLTVNGSNFSPNSVVNFNGSPLPTSTSGQPKQLSTTIPAADLIATGPFPVTVTDTGLTSNSSNFTVNNAPVSISTLEPNSAVAGSTDFNLTINGAGFEFDTNGNAITTVSFNGATLIPRPISPSPTLTIANTLVVQIPSVPTTAQTLNVTVTNPAPGGGTSNQVHFTVTAGSNPSPTLTALSPTSTTASGAAFTLTATGTNFVATSVVQFNGTNLATSFVSATQVTASVPPNLTTTISTVNVDVFNPAPGGGTSGSLPFMITTNPVPLLTSISPTSITAKNAAFPLVATGMNFDTGSVIVFNGTSVPTVFNSPTQVTGTVPSNLISNTGTVNVLVSNPSPGGGPSNAAPFTITANPAPMLTSINPTNAAVGSAAFRLTLTGANFVGASTVNFGSTRTLLAQTTTATTMSVEVPSGAIAEAGPLQITVTNPSPGGGTSAPVTFNVTDFSFGTVSPAIMTVKQGSSAQYSIPVQALNGFNAPVTLICASGVPSGAGCNFSPSPVTPTASGATVSLSISTGAGAGVPGGGPERKPPPGSLFGWAAALAGLTSAWMWRKQSKRRRAGIGLAIASVIFVGALAGCGGRVRPGATPPGSYTITINGSATNSATHTTMVTLVVTQ